MHIAIGYNCIQDISSRIVNSVSIKILLLSKKVNKQEMTLFLNLKKYFLEIKRYNRSNLYSS